MESISQNQEIKFFSIRSKVMLPYIESVELTQNSLITPFMNILGLNSRKIKTRRVVPGTEKFIVAHGQHLTGSQETPVFLVECLHHTERIKDFSVDINRFNRTVRAKYVVLTNGLDYKFYQIRGYASKKSPIPLFSFNITKTRTGNILKLLHQYLDLSFKTVSN